MTTDYAIECIKNHMKAHKLNEPNAIFITEALNMAITALAENEKYKKLLTHAVEDFDNISTQVFNNALNGAGCTVSERCENCCLSVPGLAGCCWRFHKEATDLISNNSAGVKNREEDIV